MDYKQLQDSILKDKVNVRERLVYRYRYARGKGFSAKESQFLSHCSEDTINKIAKERDSNG